MGSMLLDARKKIQRSARAGAVLLGLQAHAHDTVKGQGHEADERMGADAIWEPVMHWRDLDV